MLTFEDVIYFSQYLMQTAELSNRRCFVNLTFNHNGIVLLLRIIAYSLYCTTTVALRTINCIHKILVGGEQFRFAVYSLGVAYFIVSQFQCISFSCCLRWQFVSSVISTFAQNASKPLEHHYIAIFDVMLRRASSMLSLIGGRKRIDKCIKSMS